MFHFFEGLKLSFISSIYFFKENLKLITNVENIMSFSFGVECFLHTWCVTPKVCIQQGFVWCDRETSFHHMYRNRVISILLAVSK